MRGGLAGLCFGGAALAASLAVAQAPTSSPPAAPVGAAPASAQSALEDGSTVVEGLEVTARPLGPALWRVKRGDSEVVILGGYSPLPHSLDWNKARLQRALRGATALYVPRASIGLFSGAGVLLTLGSLSLPRGQRLPAVIGPERMRRVEAFMSRIHKDPARLMGLKPAVVGFGLYDDFARAAGLSLEKPQTTIERLAKSMGVPIRPLAKLPVASMIRSLEKLDERSQLACFDAEFAHVQAVSDTGGAAAQAWATGDLKGLRQTAAPSFEAPCLLGSPSARAVADKGVADAVASIEDALRQPGRSVAVAPIAYITRANGLLDQLKARGAEITLPID